jgi:hypothetical protein
MVLVGRLPRDRDADERDDVRRRIGQRVKALGQDGDRPGEIAQGDLDQRNREIQYENAVEDPNASEYLSLVN